jgi:SPP1 family predicted phage head-tail adaptor
MPRAGDYRNRVEIQEKSDDREASGAESLSPWRTIARRWAAIEPAGGSEGMGGGQVQGVASHVVRLRWWDGLKVTHRIKFGDRVFDINAADDMKTRRVEWVLACTEAPAES